MALALTGVSLMRLPNVCDTRCFNCDAHTGTKAVGYDCSMPHVDLILPQQHCGSADRSTVGYAQHQLHGYFGTHQVWRLSVCIALRQAAWHVCFTTRLTPSELTGDSTYLSIQMGSRWHWVWKVLVDVGWPHRGAGMSWLCC